MAMTKMEKVVREVNEKQKETEPKQPSQGPKQMVKRILEENKQARTIGREISGVLNFYRSKDYNTNREDSVWEELEDQLGPVFRR